MTTRFVLFSTARSGSSWLVTALRSHPEILCHGEALAPGLVPRHLQGAARAVLTPEMCKADPLGFARRLLAMDEGHGAVGFKVFATQGPAAHAALLSDESLHKIVLRRENALAAWSSLLIARQTGRWNTRKAGIGAGTRTRFVRAEFDHYRTRRDAYFDRIDRQLRGPRLDLTYTGDIVTKNAAPVLDFLGVDRAFDTSTAMARILGPSILDRFENAADAAACLDEIGRPDWARE
ncbi:hypothetical protein [Roseisalinus antarcticus]|uniref:Stf0 sulfotransferase n=1 Tax=Roseisalinus antarcticus TaxID=254357 RepID=A0A1Y5TQ44_9RHOB|nr:hypothetical protein [Roseisalinus antarcticus]SLN68907.1 hypothetical protein ROA7023_03339 [Roseisalinus antarcticus]